MNAVVAKLKPKAWTPNIQRADELLGRNFNPIRWAVSGLVPEGVSMLVGAPKVGKSWLALQIAIAISKGAELWPGRVKEASGEVLMLAMEDNDRRMQSRIRKMASAHEVTGLFFETSWPRMDEGGLDYLDRWLAQHPKCRLVVIDTLARFRPVDTAKTSAYAADYNIGAVLRPVADKFNVAILLLHHNRKADAADVLDTVSGTQGLAGSVDALLILRRERGQMDAALYVTGRDIETEQDYAMSFNPALCTWSSCGTAHEARRSRERKEVIDFLASHGPAKPKYIAEGMGKKSGAVRRLLQKMFAEGDLTVTDGQYSVVSTLLLGNSGNASNESNRGTGDTCVTSVTAVTEDSGEVEEHCAGTRHIGSARERAEMTLHYAPRPAT